MEDNTDNTDNTDEHHCCICSETNEEEQWHVLECNHGFHTTCIMQWFRQGNTDTCPMCRDGGDTDGGFRLMDLHARASTLRQRARRKNAPKDLVRLVKKLQKQEQKEREASKEYREYRKTNHVLFKLSNGLRRKKWRTWRRTRALKRQLGMFTHSTMPLPLVVQSHRRRRQRRSRSQFD